MCREKQGASYSSLKRIFISLSIILIIVFFYGSLNVNAAETVKKTDSNTSASSIELPAVGDVIHGFKVVSVEPIDIINAEAVVFEHEKSGAELIYIACDDENRAFDITFQTPALDNKGKAHIFEHMTICGSQKYKDPNLFFPFANNTYNTFVNAMTYHGMTSYPVASMSENQLMTMMDYYLSGVFEPLLYTEKNLVSREAWRYELDAKDSPITIAGTVYSEMQGAMNPERWAYYYDMTNLFEGSPVAYESGGIPDSIRTVTYEELINFHDTYYKPSNSLITLYGKLDYENYLSFIDKNYFSKYEKEDVYVEKGKIEPFTKTKYSRQEIAVEKDANTENASYIYYSFGADKAGLSDTEDLDLISELFSQDSSVFMQQIRNKLPEANVYVTTDNTKPVPEISFVAENVNESDRDTFVDIVDSSIESIAKNGFTQAEVDAVISNEKLNIANLLETSDLGFNVSQYISLSWTHFDTLDYYNTIQNRVNSLTAKDLTDAAEKWLYNNKYRAVTVTVPKPGLSEQKSEALANELAKLKASMTDEQINQMVEDYDSYTKWSKKQASSEMVDKMVAVSVDDLDENINEYDINDTKIDGIRWLSSDVNSNDVYTLQLRFDASGIPVDKINDVALYLLLIGELDTTQYSKEELAVLIKQFLPSLSDKLTADDCISGDDNYYAAFSWEGLGENTAMSSALFSEIINNTDFSDTETISEILNRQVSSFSSQLDSNTYNIQKARCEAVSSDTAAFKEYVTDFEFNDYCKSMIQLAESDPETLIQRLLDAKDLILNRRNLIVIATGDGSAIDSLKTNLNGTLTSLPEKDIIKTDFSSLRLKFKSEAVINNISVHMNMLFGENTDFSGKDYAISSFIDDRYMLPQLRSGKGAYGAYSYFSRTGILLYTYRDPNMKDSFTTMEALPEYLRTADISQNDVDNYIIGSYSSLIEPSGAMNDSMSQIKKQLCGETIEYRENILHELKQTKVKDVRSAADRIEKIINNGVKSTSGTDSAVQNSGITLDSIMK